MDFDRFSQLADRYTAALTDTAEERELRDALNADNATDTTHEHRTTATQTAAVEAMIRYAQSQHNQSVEIELHRPATHGWKMFLAGAMSAAAIITAVLLISRPTVYGYVNGQAVTSMAEAQRYSSQMFSDLAQDMEPTLEALDGLFSIDEN